MIEDLLKYHRTPLIFLLSCCAFYISFAYDLDRTDFPKLLSLYLALAFLSWKMYKMERRNLKFLIAASILFRLIFLFHSPGLSQDFYRFLWDGQLILEGMNPYISTPGALLASGHAHFDNAARLVSGMGSLSEGNHSNYPPLSQLLYAFAALFTGKSLMGGVIALRGVLMLAEVGIFYFGRKLLKNFHLPEDRIFWFLLNPLVIIELTGNLHLEGVMIFFLLWALYLLQRNRWVLGALVFSFAVSIKLIPLLFLPLLIVYFRKTNNGINIFRLLSFYSLVAVTFLTGFLPFLSSELVSEYLATVGLWFQKFEFNASIYYLVRWVGFLVKGYNIIATAGIVLGVGVFAGILGLAGYFWKRRRADILVRPTGLLAGICLYYFLATTIHPWYLTLPLILCIFTRFRFPLVWAVTVVFSYSAYSSTLVDENLWLVAVEYLMVYGYLVYEVISKSKEKSPYSS